MTRKHSPDLCFAKPQNFAARDKKREELIRAGLWRGLVPRQSDNRTSNTSTANVNELVSAMKQMNVGNGNQVHTTSLNVEYVCSNSAATAPIPPTGDWALDDTGSSHHMFNKIEFFNKESIVPNTDPSRRLTLAGGNQTLAVACSGTVELADDEGGMIRFENSIYVPELNKNLIAG